MTEPKTLVRDNLCRSVPFTMARAADDTGDGRTFQGYGAVFNTPTRIDSWEGTFDEQIAPGAFRKSIRERTPRFQFDHGRHPLIGSIPIGRITDIHEDLASPAPAGGLFVESRLSDNWLVEPIRDAIAEGSVDGMSFRFSVVREEWRDKDGKLVKPEDVLDLLWHDSDRGPLLRILKEVKVDEVGPVVWPAYEQTSASVRSKILYFDRLHEPEQRKLLAHAVLLADTAERPSGRSADEPQDTTDVAVEHSDEDNDTPPPTREAGPHESISAEPVPVDHVDAIRAAAFEQQFTDAVNEVKNARESTPLIRSI